MENLKELERLDRVKKAQKNVEIAGFKCSVWQQQLEELERQLDTTRDPVGLTVDIMNCRSSLNRAEYDFKDAQDALKSANADPETVNLVAENIFKRHRY